MINNGAKTMEKINGYDQAVKLSRPNRQATNTRVLDGV
jgi:hypothetical protein